MGFTNKSFSFSLLHILCSSHHWKKQKTGQLKTVYKPDYLVQKLPEILIHWD